MSVSETGRVVVLPPVPALLPAYRGRVDTLAELREACRAAVAWLVHDFPGPIVVLADELDEAARARGISESQGVRVARYLLDEAGFRGRVDTTARAGQRLLVLANGSARRTEKAPGHLDPRSFDFDAAIEKALAEGDPAGLAAVDPGLGHDLLAAGIEPLRGLGALPSVVTEARLRYAADPYGVRYWVASWSLAAAR